MQEREATQAERVRFRRMIATASHLEKLEREYRKVGRVEDAERVWRHKEEILREAGK
jgi:hypothetical protein